MLKKNSILSAGLCISLVLLIITLYFVYGGNNSKIDTKNIKDVDGFISSLNKEMPRLAKKYSVPGSSIRFIEN
jgi:hypothetical protein